MTLLSTMRTPNGNILELHEEEGHYLTRLYVMDTTVEVSEDQARDWCGRTRACGGVIRARFPREVAS
ncbi:MAG TPA: hypothetical protein DCQ64_26545 [Candidatus Rokubacteria bacterium]|nr:hypothetical protein [Candidatus Rokubacteria bacterium]